MLTTVLPQAPEIAQLPDGLWVADLKHINSQWHAHPDDNRTPREYRPLTEQSRQWAAVLGVTEGEMTVYLVSERHMTPSMRGNESIERVVRLVSPKPFVAVIIREPDAHCGHPRYGCVMAQLVRRGRLGSRPFLKRRPQVAYPVFDPDRKVNWVRLSELAGITGVSAAEIIRDYAVFSPSTHGEPNVPLARGEYITQSEPDIFRLYTSAELPKNYTGREKEWGGDNADTLELACRSLLWDPHNLWVPESFAHRVIRLISFGYRPGQPLPVASCQIATPMPEQPELPLPVLSVDELRELHELRMRLAEEHPESVFRQMALSALSFSQRHTWRKVPQSPDAPHDAYTDFKQIERATGDGRVVISVCYWDRVSAQESNNHYAGFLAVFPVGIDVTDAYRDSRAILRIWFWPRELVRQIPSGSKGGLCPPEVPANCAALVERFLFGLGYDF